MTRGIVFHLSLLTVLLAVMTMPAQAEELLSAPTAPEQQTAQNTKTFSGVEIGTLRLLPKLSISGVYDDNIFATRTKTKSDRILHLIPTLDLRSHWPEHRIGLNMGADVARHEKYSDENFEDYWFTAEGRYDLSEAINLFGGMGYSREHEERGSPDDQNGIEPTIFDSKAAHIGTEIKTGKLKFRFGGTFEELDFDDVETSTEFSFNNDDRDRQLLGAGIRVAYDWTGSLQPYAQYIYDERNYDISLDDNGYRRDSDGYQLAAGFKYVIQPDLSTEFYYGILHQDYSDGRLAAVRTPDFGIKLQWLPNPVSKIGAVVERSIEETTIPGSSGYLKTCYAINFGYDLSRDTSFHSNLQFSEEDYQGIPRKDDDIAVGFGLQYDLTRNLFIGADYNFSHRNSNIQDSSTPDSENYYRHQFMVSLGARLYPVKDDPLEGFNQALSELYSVSESPRGFYLGGVYSYGAMMTHASEERLHGGSSQADFGGDGTASGIFAGYNINHNRWVYGVELEAENSSLEWKHVKNKTESRTFSIKQNEGLGASLRLGYMMLDGSILYGRAGFIKTRLDTDYQINDTPEDKYSETETLSGLRLGVGVDVPLSQQWFWRIESTYTDYEPNAVKSAEFNESFESKEHFFSFGLGWRFNALQESTYTPNDKDLNGPYAGVQIGFGTLSSDVEGEHRDGGGSSTGPFPYKSDFAGQGVNSGLFVGYGKIFNSFYIGAEIEAEVNGMEWARERKTSGGGRNFSVEAKEGYGASARFGYQSHYGSLTYLRAGIISTKVITRYAKGGNRSSDIYRDVSLDGIRFGIGFETPINRKVFARLEYTHTRYDDYDLITSHTNSDQLKFKNSQNMVRAGFLFRF